MSCYFCSNIKNLDEMRKLAFWDRENAIVKNSSGRISLWVECDDSYYSRPIMDISFCPMCGKYLYDAEEK